MPMHRIPMVANVEQTIVLLQQGFIAFLASTIARSNVVKVRTEDYVMDRVISVPLENGRVKMLSFQTMSAKIVQEGLGRTKPDFALKTNVKIVQKDTMVSMMFLF